VDRDETSPPINKSYILFTYNTKQRPRQNTLKDYGFYNYK